MTRLGWIILAVIVLVAAAFAPMTRFGTARHRERVDIAVTQPLPPAASGTLLINDRGNLP